MAIEIDSPSPRFEAARVRINEDLLEELRKIYEEASKSAEFPRRCGRVSREVAGLGLNYVEGHFRLDLPINNNPSLLKPHVWCEDMDGRIIDLTAVQFNPGLRTPFPPGVLVIEPTQPEYQRYDRRLDASILMAWNI